jgi:hypothetical protein
MNEKVAWQFEKGTWTIVNVNAGMLTHGTVGGESILDTDNSHMLSANEYYFQT